MDAHVIWLTAGLLALALVGAVAFAHLQRRIEGLESDLKYADQMRESARQHCWDLQQEIEDLAAAGGFVRATRVPQKKWERKL